MKPHIEKDVEDSHLSELHLKFFTWDSVFLIVAAIIFAAIKNESLNYLAWACLLAAFIVPMIRSHPIQKRPSFKTKP